MYPWYAINPESGLVATGIEIPIVLTKPTMSKEEIAMALCPGRDLVSCGHWRRAFLSQDWDTLVLFGRRTFQFM